jgi:hypothetical protein
MEKKYTTLRKFYAWVGFIVLVVAISAMLTVIINFWVRAIIK